MADITITGPDGSTFNFPVGTPAETIEGAMRSHYATYKPPAAAPEAAKPEPEKAQPSAVSSAVKGAAQGLSFGFGDEGSAVAGASPIPGAEKRARILPLPDPIDMIAGGGRMLLEKTGLIGNGGGEAFDRTLDARRAEDKAHRDANPISYGAGEIGSSMVGGLGLAKTGLSATANAINAGRSLPRVAMAGGKEGAIIGSLFGLGGGEGLEGKAEGAAKGLVSGGLVGAAVPPLVAGVSALAKPLVAPVMARLRPDEYAASAIGEGVKRSGRDVDEIARLMQGARIDGQDGFTVADAMGNAGQRMLSTVARTPNDARQAVAETLISRQMDQGRRVAGALQDATGTPQTAAQYEAALAQQRAANAGRNYAPVEQDVNPINISRPVGIANRTISPVADNVANATGAVPTDLAARAGIEAGEAAIRDPIREAVKQARSYLAADTLTVTNVEKAFRAKTNIDQMIADAAEKGRGGVVDALKPIRDALDDKLAKSSPKYAAARDAYRADSAPIDAIATGRDMARPRTRTADNLATFGALDEANQNAARVGYFDPMIARAESTAGSMTNAARPFTSDSMRRELPVIAAPGEGDRLMRRLGREAEMSETSRAALGGSKTADNLADAEEMAKFDPGIMTNIAKGEFVKAIASLIARARNEAGGLPPRVIERVAKTMMETDPGKAAEALRMAGEKSSRDQTVRAIATSIMNNLASGTAGRLAAP